MPITNIIDHRKRPYRFLKVNAVVEPTRHDNRVKDADQAGGKDNWIGYDEREHVSLCAALQWGATFQDEVTLFLYDEDGGLYEVQPRADGHSHSNGERTTGSAVKDSLTTEPNL